MLREGQGVNKHFLLYMEVCITGLHLHSVRIYVSVKSKLQHAPPPSGIPRAFDTFAVPGRREFHYQSLPGGGEFDPHALGVGNLNCTLDSSKIFGVASYHGGRGVRGFSWKRLCLCGQLVTRKELKQALFRI